MADKIKVTVDESLKGLIPGYLEDIGIWISEIYRLSEEENFEVICSLTHKMTGSGAGYGFDFISRAGSEANQAARDKDAVLVRKWMEKLGEYLDGIEIIYVDDEDEFDF